MWNFKNTLTGTLTGVRISAVDDIAFLDNCVALQPYADGRSVIQLYDANGKYVEGILGNLGTGITLNPTPNYSSNFSSGVDSFIAYKGTQSENNDGILGEDDWLKYYCDGSTDLHYTRRSLSVVVGTVVKLEASLYIPNSGGNTYLQGVNISFGAGAVVSNILMTTLGSKVSVSTYLSVAGSTIVIWGRKNNGWSFTGANSATDDLFYIKDIIVTKVLSPSTQGIIIKNNSGQQRFINKETGFICGHASNPYKLFTNVRI